MNKPFIALRDAMASRQMTYAVLSKDIHCSRRYIMDRFNGHKPFTIEDMYAIMDTFALPHDQLHIFFPKGGYIDDPPMLL